MAQNLERLIAGQWEMSIGNTLIPASLLGDIKISYAEGKLEAKTQAGVRKQPSGKAETAEASFTLFLPSLEYVGKFWQDAYNAGKSGLSGNVVFGKGKASARVPLPINFHQAGETTDENDIHIFAGLVDMNFNPTLSTSDALSVELTIQAQPTENGYFRIGTGDLTKKSVYDAATQATVAAPAS